VTDNDKGGFKKKGGGEMGGVGGEKVGSWRGTGNELVERVRVDAVDCLQHTPAYVSIRQHTSAYVSIRQHTS